jgi:hypothetical protein
MKFLFARIIEKVLHFSKEKNKFFGTAENLQLEEIKKLLSFGGLLVIYGENVWKLLKFLKFIILL